jgi:hypothetical protein
VPTFKPPPAMSFATETDMHGLKILQ